MLTRTRTRTRTLTLTPTLTLTLTLIRVGKGGKGKGRGEQDDRTERAQRRIMELLRQAALQRGPAGLDAPLEVTSRPT